MDILSKKPEELTVGENIGLSIAVAIITPVAMVAGVAVIGVAIDNVQKLRSKRAKTKTKKS